MDIFSLNFKLNILIFFYFIFAFILKIEENKCLKIRVMVALQLLIRREKKRISYELESSYFFYKI